MEGRPDKYTFLAYLFAAACLETTRYSTAMPVFLAQQATEYPDSNS